MTISPFRSLTIGTPHLNDVARTPSVAVAVGLGLGGRPASVMACGENCALTIARPTSLAGIAKLRFWELLKPRGGDPDETASQVEKAPATAAWRGRRAYVESAGCLPDRFAVPRTALQMGSCLVLLGSQSQRLVFQVATDCSCGLGRPSRLPAQPGPQCPACGPHRASRRYDASRLQRGQEPGRLPQADERS